MNVFEQFREAMDSAIKDVFGVQASTILLGCTEPTSFTLIDFRRPDVNPVTGMQSADYEIHYVYADAPTLAEGAEIIVEHADGDVLYRVRQEPYIDPGRGSDGHYRSAYLTRV